MDAIPISVTILTKDSARLMREVLGALQSFDEIILLDNGSTDGTMEIAREFPNVKIHRTEFKGNGPLHNEATGLARNNWILALDSDEVLSAELLAEIRELRLDESCVYTISMKNFFNGKWIRCCGWDPDRHVRLYNRRRTCYSDEHVHASVLSKGLREIALKNQAHHYSYTCLADFITKTQRYSDWWAQENEGRKKSSLGIALVRAMSAFVKSYVLKCGFLGGREGFIISMHQFITTYYRYLKLLEANERNRAADSNVPSRR